MELLYLCFFGSIYLFVMAGTYKIRYVENVATCLEYHHSKNIYHVLYEYKVKEADGKMKKYISWGSAFLQPKVGKIYRVFVHKNKHNKIVAYNEYIFCLVLGSIIMFGIFYQCIFLN